MRKLILCAGLLIPTLGFSQDPVILHKEVICAPTAELLSSIQKEFKEQPVWFGSDQNSKYVLLVNKNTKGWTFVQFNNQVACVIGVGSDHKSIGNDVKFNIRL